MTSGKLHPRTPSPRIDSAHAQRRACAVDVRQRITSRSCYRTCTCARCIPYIRSNAFAMTCDAISTQDGEADRLLYSIGSG